MRDSWKRIGSSIQTKLHIVCAVFDTFPVRCVSTCRVRCLCGVHMILNISMTWTRFSSGEELPLLLTCLLAQLTASLLAYLLACLSLARPQPVNLFLCCSSADNTLARNGFPCFFNPSRITIRIRNGSTVVLVGVEARILEAMTGNT